MNENNFRKGLYCGIALSVLFSIAVKRAYRRGLINGKKMAKKESKIPEIIFEERVYVE